MLKPLVAINRAIDTFFDSIRFRNPEHADDEINGEGPATVQPMPFDETARRAEFTGCRDK